METIWLQFFPQTFGRVRQYDLFADIDSIDTEGCGLGVACHDPLLGPNMKMDRGKCLLGECRWIVEQPAAFEGAETRIQMIAAGAGKF